MRINKRLLPGSNKKENTYLEIDCNKLGEGVGWVFLVTVGSLVVFWMYTSFTTSASETNRYNNTCKKIARGQDFYVSEGNNRQCIIIPSNKSKQTDSFDLIENKYDL